MTEASDAPILSLMYKARMQNRKKMRWRSAYGRGVLSLLGDLLPVSFSNSLSTLLTLPIPLGSHGLFTQVLLGSILMVFI